MEQINYPFWGDQEVKFSMDSSHGSSEADSKGEELPWREVPGSYGVPVIGAMKDKLDFFYFQGETEFWASRIKKYNSTVFRVNVPPAPPGFSSNKVIMLLDQKSFPILFDMTKVEKKDVLLANYMPSSSFFGGIRPCIYLDPSEERHTKIKSFIMDLIKSKASKWIPEMQNAMEEIFPVWENELSEKGRAEVNAQTSQVACNVLIRTLVGRDPTAPGEASLKNHGPSLFLAWLGPQLAPIASVSLPGLVEEILIHTSPIPYFIVSNAHKKIVKFFETHATELLDMAERQYGLERHDTLHNLIFTLGFNAFGGLYLFFPTLVNYVGGGDMKLHEDLAMEVRKAVKEEGGKLTVAAVEKMELVKSTVYEALRISPPVPYLYAKAKEDLTIESHEAKFKVKKGEIIGGCQTFAARDPRVFDDPDIFKADRFVGERGKKLLCHVLWANGPADGHPSIANKQCAASDLVPFLCQTFLACLFLKYDSFTTLEPIGKGHSTTHYFSALKNAA